MPAQQQQTLTFTATYQQDGAGWAAWVDEVPGAISQGATLDEARVNLREAVLLMLEEYGDDIPAAEPTDEAELAVGAVVREPIIIFPQMKRVALVAHLRRHGCELHREGGSHSIFINTATGKKTAVPRHAEILDTTARKICDQLGVPRP